MYSDHEKGSHNWCIFRNWEGASKKHSLIIIARLELEDIDARSLGLFDSFTTLLTTQQFYIAHRDFQSFRDLIRIVVSDLKIFPQVIVSAS